MYSVYYDELITGQIPNEVYKFNSQAACSIMAGQRALGSLSPHSAIRGSPNVQCHFRSLETEIYVMVTDRSLYQAVLFTLRKQSEGEQNTFEYIVFI
jgi:hypothetical protein